MRRNQPARFNWWFRKEKTLEEKEADRFRAYMITQFGFLIGIGISFLFWWIHRFWAPDFFHPFKYLLVTEDIFGCLLRNWPLFLYAFVMASIGIFYVKDFLAEEILVKNTITSIGAGVTEELGFRCIFIFTAMCGIWLFNLAWSWLILFLGIGAFIVAFVLFLKAHADKSPKVLWGVIGFVVLGLGLLWLRRFFDNDPLYWFYESVVFPVVNFITFKKFDSIINGPYEILFIAGMISANAKFRDGHKYQGLIGVLNAWIIGFYLMKIMLTQGLVIAIIVHVIYDLEFAGVRYLARKLKG